jgi:hypothetical protein
MLWSVGRRACSVLDRCSPYRKVVRTRVRSCERFGLTRRQNLTALSILRLVANHPGRRCMNMQQAQTTSATTELRHATAPRQMDGQGSVTPNPVARGGRSHSAGAETTARARRTCVTGSLHMVVGMSHGDIAVSISLR